jgi:uncharacterized protein YjbI with pentapeptide repeats
MSRIKIGFLAAAAGAIVAIALPVDAMAFGRGGGGGGGGGGGRSIGGGGGGSFHGFSGGGAARSFGGGGIGAMHVAPSISHAPAYSVRSYPGVGIRSGMPHSIGMTSRSLSGTTLRGNRSLGVTRLGAHGLTSRGARIAGANSIRGTRGALTNATLRDGRLAGAGVAGARLTGARLASANGQAWHNGALRNGAWNGVRWNHRGDWWHHRPFFGWAGPVFWPWFYDDFFYYTFWDYGPYYDAPFWAYGYGDIYGAMFSPYGYDGLAGWAPPRGGRTRTAVARGNPPSQPAQPSQASQWTTMCGADAQVASLPIDRITAAVSPDEQQRAALDALANASQQAAQTIKTACPTDVAYTPTGRLDVMERRVQAMVQAVAMIRPPLDTFYGLLSDEQKARFNALGQNQRPDNPRSPLAACGPNAAALPTWPQQQIEKAVQPNEGQRALLDRLKDAGAKAADTLKASCPAEPPATPPARLAAMAARLDAMLQGVQLVHQALNDFYGSLTDEQKAQFNGIPPVVQNGQPKG